jgi:transposase
MKAEREFGNLKVPQSDWEATPTSVQHLVITLLEQMNQLNRRVEELEEQTRKNSKNSSKPPSKDEASAKNAQKKIPNRKVIGFKPRQGKQERELYGPEACQSIHDEKPQVCPDCAEALSGDDAAPLRHQIVEMPIIKPEIEEYRLHELECAHCGRKTRASLPPGVSQRCYGPRLAGWIGLLSGAYRQSHRQVGDLLVEGFGIKLSRGSINRARQEVSESLASVVEATHAYVVQQPVVNCDETGFAQRNQDGLNPHNRRGWLWVLVTPLVTFFSVTLSRSQATAQELLSRNFGGYLGSDRYSSYAWLDPKRRQVCWAHLLRDFQAMAERSGVSALIGTALLVRGHRLFHWWHRVRDGTLSQELFIEAVTQLRVGFITELEAAANLPIGSKEKTPFAKTVRTCAKILAIESALWSFVSIAGVEPTNNAAERALRPAVIWKYTSFGSQSQAGSEFVARILTVNATLKAQRRSVLEFLTQACQAARLGSNAPSLLPRQTHPQLPQSLIML